MRFFANGPSIPDELLVARDEGRVIFFCGAGVSRARAGLPDFFGLAQKVIEALGVSSDSPARKIVEESRQIESKIGLNGLISADRVFGLLEREFVIRDIQAAVANALKPNSVVDISAHRIMLDLAKLPDGRVRLVTTNFDRLFESCDSSLRSWRPPHLPAPQHYEDFEGIIHVHGCVDRNYFGADGDGFILSSSEFGRAYLSEGWATQFIRSILDRYIVVFVGYTADDPPVQYLLEALNRGVESRAGLYAFQSGSESEAQSKWLHKGVQPLAYDETENHKVLWDTLAAWAIRARDPDGWYENTIELSRRGPEVLLPHERGQIAHVVSTLEGVKKFAAANEPPPADWLCVLDPVIRYAKPVYLWDINGKGPYFDPFAAYGLDSDVVPSKVDPDDYFTKREVPQDAWDCFAVTPVDRKNLDVHNLPAFRGYGATHFPRLSVRLSYLSQWISKVSDQTAAVWWASGQSGIHPDLRSHIQSQFERVKATHPAEIRRAWRYIFEAWENGTNIPDVRWYQFDASIKLDGWTNSAVRQLAKLSRPRLVAKRPWNKPRPPTNTDEIDIQDIVELDVEYPSGYNRVQVPNEYIESTVREIRKNLEHAVSLETELGGHGLSLLAPIEPDQDLQGISTGRGLGISGALLFYVGLFRKLVEESAAAAKQECLAWPPDDDTVFAALRIWASGNHRIFSAEEAGDTMCLLNDAVFWDSRHQRDLLLVLAKRWSDFPGRVKNKLGDRLLNGPPRWDGEEIEEYEERRAWSSLNRIEWLRAQGCNFDFDVDTEIGKLRQRAPKWQPQYAQKTAASMEPRGGWVRTDTEHEALLSVPLDKVLDTAKKLGGHDHEMLVERNPFAGLASQRPTRAFSALTVAGKRGDHPSWAWRTFLNADARKSDKPRFSALIAERVSTLPPHVIAENLHPLCDWLLNSSAVLLKTFPAQFDRLWTKLLSVLRSEDKMAQSSIVRGNKEPDWPMEGLKSPVGKLAQVLMNDPQKDSNQNGPGLPLGWIGRVNELLSLKGDLHRHALVMFAFNLNWFFRRDRVWTERNLLSSLNGDVHDQNALWAGVFWAGQTPDRELFQRLKPHLLMLAKQNSVRRHEYAGVLAAIVLAGWGNIDTISGGRYVTSEELRNLLITADDDFRSHVLWHLERWSSEKQGESNTWEKSVPVFLNEVWPRQRSAKTPRMTAKLCDLAFSDSLAFTERVDLILPLVTKIDEAASQDLLRLEEHTATEYPEKTLSLLSAILPENASIWPYHIESILDAIGDSDPALLKDPRLIELRRRWNSR